MDIRISSDDSGPVYIPVIHGGKPALPEDFERDGMGHVGLAGYGALSTVFRATLGGNPVATVLVSQDGGVMNADLVHDAAVDPRIDARLLQAVRKFAQQQQATALRFSVPANS